jgi:O-antigen ligase
MHLIGLARQNPNWLVIALIFALIALALIGLPLTNAVIVIGGALAALAVLRWHELALYALVFAVPFGSWFPLPTGFGTLTAVDLLVALILVLWLARMIAQERAIVIRFPPLALPFALFLGGALMSMLGALSLEASIKEFTKWFEMLAMYVYVANTLGETQLDRLLAALFLAGIGEAAIGIYQFWFRVGPEGFLLFDRFIRAYGTFEQPNPFAGYLALIAPIALGVALNQNNGSRITPRTSRITFYVLRFSLVALATITLIATLSAILMSWSRGAWLGVGAGLIVTIIVQSRRAFVLSLIAAFVLTFAILLSSINLIPTAIADRFSGIADYFGVFDVRGVKVDDANFAIVERMAHWQSAAMMFGANPVLGVGIGNYAAAYPKYSLPRWDDPLGHAHNYYLNVAAETGAIGLLAYLLLWAAAFWQNWRAVRGASNVWQSVAAGLLGMLVALSVHNTFDNLFVHGIAVQVGIGLGIAAAILGANVKRKA